MTPTQRAVIVANGMLAHPESLAREIRPGDILIAADGGGRLCRQAGLVPHYLVGDFDSLPPQDLEYFVSLGSQALRFPERKDFTDLELALRHARSLGCTQALVLAALGDRWDQTLANVLLPAAHDLHDLQIRLVDGPQEITLILPGRDLEIDGLPGDTVSLIPLAGDAAGVVTSGLEYPLRAGTLVFGATRGISNVISARPVSISIQSGMLLCVVIHQASGAPRS